METDKIKDLFKNYEPELTSDFVFMNKLKRNLDSVEIIHQRNAQLKSKNTIALIIAASIGFLVGFLFSYTIPYLCRFISYFQEKMVSDIEIMFITDNSLIFSWLMFGIVTVFATIQAYNISISLLTSKTK